MANGFFVDGTNGKVKTDSPLRGNVSPLCFDDASIAMTDADFTLTSSQYECMYLTFTGTLTAGRNIIVPTAKGTYCITNSTTGGFALTPKTSGGTGFAIAAGKTAFARCDGTNVIRLTADV